VFKIKSILIFNTKVILEKADFCDQANFVNRFFNKLGNNSHDQFLPLISCGFLLPFNFFRAAISKMVRTVFVA